MKTKDKVITFEQAKKIAELLKEKELPESEKSYSEHDGQVMAVGYYPAYDVAELYDILNKYLISHYTSSIEDKKIIAIQGETNKVAGRLFVCNTQAEALGELLIYLLENDKL